METPENHGKLTRVGAKGAKENSGERTMSELTSY